VKRSTLVRVVATVVVAVFFVGIWLMGGKPDPEWLRLYSAAVLLATASLWLWETVLWRLPLVQRLPNVPRNLRGTWKGTLDSFWIDPSTGKPLGKKPAYLVIRQTAFTVSAILLTDESKSVSAAGVVSTGGGVASLDYMYLNRPNPSVEHRSRMHHGSASLDISGRPARRLHGRYWTDRDTRGELDFTERNDRLVDDYTEAESMFG